MSNEDALLSTKYSCQFYFFAVFEIWIRNNRFAIIANSWQARAFTHPVANPSRQPHDELVEREPMTFLKRQIVTKKRCLRISIFWGLLH
jgi:hypothetical protein